MHTLALQHRQATQKGVGGKRRVHVQVAPENLLVRLFRWRELLKSLFLLLFALGDYLRREPGALDFSRTLVFARTSGEDTSRQSDAEGMNESAIDSFGSLSLFPSSFALRHRLLLSVGGK
jgi:hypothetical protein